MTDSLDALFFADVESKVLELEAVAKDYKTGVIALIVPITPEGNARFRLLRPGMKREELLEVLARAYDWAVQQVESDPRLK